MWSMGVDILILSLVTLQPFLKAHDDDNNNNSRSSTIGRCLQISTPTTITTQIPVPQTSNLGQQICIRPFLASSAGPRAICGDDRVDYVVAAMDPFVAGQLIIICVFSIGLSLQHASQHTDAPQSKAIKEI